MTKAELVGKLANKSKLSRKQAVDVVNAITQSISDSLATGNKVEIRGFGSFVIRERNARIAHNPRSREIVEVPAKRVPFFKAGNDLRKVVDG
ncbi:MAG TPA: integration host factor subunit beta [Dehalococcoidia bacterium]|nr:integration host factor subunit beta [Dehalococcoidia bacterium]